MWEHSILQPKVTSTVLYQAVTARMRMRRREHTMNMCEVVNMVIVEIFVIMCLRGTCSSSGKPQPAASDISLGTYLINPGMAGYSTF